VLCLNRRNRLITIQEVSSGTATSSLLHPREVFRQALRYGAPAAIVAHNHPSGDPSPSSADRAVTRQLVEAGRVIGVELLDHVIIGRPESDPIGKGWFSFGEAGLI
jgi:DNA repair protein RadC